ncbi:PDIL1-1 [Symbiodinium pilosum]|uniref:PDIL1-1 protein n=1 Tax=Symbiodinium pilosum TaxID=2952 RepID=A0A812IM38_SYMPI|nr:PDIL1-1 [Symbiodinium pilosum]
MSEEEGWAECTSQFAKEFVETKRRIANVAILLHDAKCPHCRKALPELDRVAETFRSEEVFLAHADCTRNKSNVQSEFGLKGFPGFLFWRQSDPLDELVGQAAAVDEDVDFMLRASRLAEIGKERDGARRALAGEQVTVKAMDSKDMTVQVEGPKGQLVWIPHETLLLQGRRVPYRRGDGLARYKNVWEKDACIASMLECFGAAPMQLQKLGWSQGRPQPY